MAKRKNKKNTLTYDTLPALFEGICDAIRTQTGETGLISHQDIPDKILAIETGGDTIVCINEAFTVAAYSSAAKTYTVEKAGTINVLAVGDGVGQNQLGIAKNGAGVTEYVSFKNSAGNAMVRSAVITVAANDVISVNITTASVQASIMALAILTPTT